MTPINLDEVPPQGWKGFAQFWKIDLLAAISVALVALPLGLGIAVAAGAPPMSGLISVIVGGVVTTFIRGSHIAINGPANLLVVVALAASDNMSSNGESGFAYAMAAFVVSGFIQVILGFFRLGKLANLVPSAAIHGMLAAIGCLIIGTQIHHVLGIDSASLTSLSENPANLLDINPFILIISLICLIVLIAYPRITFSFVRLVPAPMWVLFIAIPLYFTFSLFSGSVSEAWQLGEQYLVQLPKNITEGLIFPDFSRINEPIFWFTVFMVTVILSVESLAISKAVDKLDPYKRITYLDKDLVGIGAATMVSGFLGGLPITTVIAQSSVNINTGAKTKWSNLMHGLLVIIFILAFSNIIQLIPVAALAAILIYTGYMLTSPNVFRRAFLEGWEQLVILVITLLSILTLGLITGLFIGIAFTIILHFFKSGMPIKLFLRYTRRPFVKIVQEKKKTYLLKVKGIVNFTNILQLQSKINKLDSDKNIIMDFSHARLVDFTVLEYLHEYAAKYNRNGGEFHFTGLDVHKTSSHHPYALHVLEAPKPKNVRLTRRQVELKQLAQARQWEYLPEIEWNVTDLQSFSFFKTKPVEYQKNQLNGSNEMLEVSWKICDIALRNVFISFETYQLTVEILKLSFEVPVFTLEEESFLDRMSLLADQKDIDFVDYKNFSKKFIVLGPNESAIRKLFNPELVRFFEKGEIYHLESTGSELLIFRHLRLTSPREIEKMVSYSEKLVEKLQEATLVKT